MRYPKIYLSGPISKAPNKDRFYQAAALFNHIGIDTENPADYEGIMPPDTTYPDYIAYGIKRMQTCDAFYFMEGWEDSTGCKIEFEIAKMLCEQGKPIFSYRTDLKEFLLYLMADN